MYEVLFLFGKLIASFENENITQPLGPEACNKFQTVECAVNDPKENTLAHSNASWFHSRLRSL